MTIPTREIGIEDSWHVTGLQGTGSPHYRAHDLVLSAAYEMPFGRTAPRRGGAWDQRQRGEPSQISQADESRIRAMGSWVDLTGGRIAHPGDGLLGRRCLPGHRPLPRLRPFQA